MNEKDRGQQSGKEPAQPETFPQPTAQQTTVEEREMLTEPRAWALAWDGFALSEIREQRRESQ